MALHNKKELNIIEMYNNKQYVIEDVFNIMKKPITN